MRATFVILLLIATTLAGCNDPRSTPATTQQGPAGQELDDLAPVALRFVTKDRNPTEDTLSVTISQQDACIPVSCSLYAATGGDPAFFKIIDVSSLLPIGMHAFFEADATWERQNPVSVLGGMTLGWWSQDIWISEVHASADTGMAHLESYVSSSGPDPAELVLIVREPEGLTGPVEVEIQIHIVPLDDSVAPTHVVAARLEGGAVPIILDAKGTLQVRGPDDSLVLEASVAADEPVELPADTPRGEYLLTVFGTEEPVRILVPASNLTSPLMRLSDTSSEFGDPHPMPSGDELTWTVDYPTTPYQVGVVMDSYDGRSTVLQNVQVKVTAPDGTAVVSDNIPNSIGLNSRLYVEGDLADTHYTPGTYTFTVSTDFAQGWQVYDAVSLYGP